MIGVSFRQGIRIGLFVTLLGLLFLFFYFKRQAIVCELISEVGFNEIAPHIFVDQSVDAHSQKQLLTSLHHAQDRINTVYGQMASKPRIIVSKDETIADYGFNLIGMQSSGFARECVFIGPKGINVDVLAHELVHAEVRHRVNLFTELTKLPAWFIEGTGMKVDYRDPYLLDNINLTDDDVEQIKDIFFLHNFPRASIKAYQASKLAIEQIDAKSLYDGLERLNEGAHFDAVFGD